MTGVTADNPVPDGGVRHIVLHDSGCGAVFVAQPYEILTRLGRRHQQVIVKASTITEEAA